MQYMILEGDSATELAELVQGYLTDGWEPCGGVAVTVLSADRDGDPVGWLYAQAMIRRNKQS